MLHSLPSSVGSQWFIIILNSIKSAFLKGQKNPCTIFFIVYQVNAKSFNSEYIFSFRIFSILKTILWKNKWWWNRKFLVWDSLVLCLLVVFLPVEILVCRNTTVTSTINLRVPIGTSVYSVFKSLLERWCMVCWILHALKKNQFKLFLHNEIFYLK